MSQTIENFGKYILLEKLGMGGMAEIYLARSAGAGGVSKFVAIKKILPQYSEQPEFIDMFKDEAKIAVNLSHANIVSIFEFGMEKQQLFLAMDYVEGRNLRQIQNKMKKSGVTFSIEQVLYIIKEVAAGLDHAHRCIDPNTGKPLNIIHRDMSPQNIMISFEGELKVVDFGIAKAETQVESTRAGTVKGKFGYMSPEQAEGQNIDLRTDIFALGIVLWELLANDRLFVANNEMNTLRKIRDCQIPSLRKINPNIPPELERIVVKALAKDRNLRYQTAGAFQREISRFLNRQYPDFSAQDFSVFIKTLFAGEILDSRKKMVEYAKFEMKALPAPAFAPVSGPAPVQLPAPDRQEQSGASIAASTGTSMPQTAVTENTADHSEFNRAARVDTMDVPAPPSPKKLTPPPAMPAAPNAQKRPPATKDGRQIFTPPSELSTRDLRMDRGARVREHTSSGAGTYYGTRSISNRSVSAFRSTASLIFPAVVLITAMLFGGISYILQSQERKNKANEFLALHAPWSVELLGPILGDRALRASTDNPNIPLPPGARAYTLSVQSSPSGAEVLVNGQAKDITPAQISLPENKDFTITVRMPGYLEKTQTVRLTSPGEVKVALEAEKRGALDVVVLGAGNLYIDNKLIQPPYRGIQVIADREILVRVSDPRTNASDEMRVRVAENATQRITLTPRAQRAPK